MFLFGPPNVEKLKTKRNIPGLVKALEYKKESGAPDAAAVRQQAADALGEIGDAAGIDALIAALHDVHEKVREAATQALMKISDARAATPFIELFLRGAETERKTATEALVKMGAPAVQALISPPYLYSKNEVVHETAAGLLGKIGAPAVERLVAELDRVYDWEKRMAIGDALAKIGKPSLEPLMGLLMSGNVIKRGVAAAALKQMNWHPTRDAAGAVYWVETAEPLKCVAIGAPAVEALTGGLASAPMSDTRKNIMVALYRIGDPRAIPALIAHLTKGAYESEQEAAANVLVGFGQKAVEPLLAVLMDNNSRLRAAAARVLGRIGDARAIGPLTDLLKDYDGDVETAAKKALSRIESAAAASSPENAAPPPDEPQSTATD